MNCLQAASIQASGFSSPFLYMLGKSWGQADGSHALTRLEVEEACLEPLAWDGAGVGKLVLGFWVLRIGGWERCVFMWDLKMPGRRLMPDRGMVGKEFPPLGLLCIPCPMTGPMFSPASWWQRRKQGPGDIKGLGPGHRAGYSRAILGPLLLNSKPNLSCLSSCRS